ncbi:MAG TPA: SpoIIE family protein phosphatase [Egibacteraceae bacterium]|nr:SpoIIE family protein phosphatase [Egibacteraceae bacterium]
MTHALSFRRVWRRERRKAVTVEESPQATPAPAAVQPDVDIAPNDPLLAYLTSSAGAVDLDSLELESQAVTDLREAGMKLVVPLVTHGELVGLLSLGPRLSEQEYSREDRKLLDDLAGYAAPAVRVAQLVREQKAEVQERSRLEQELKVATLIQQQFLPKELPHLAGWDVAAYYQPAREVGGDFYDFIDLPDGKVGIVVGDVTDKGVPAALIMAKTHSIMRADAPRLVEPGAVLARANSLLAAEMPPNMFVTCLYAVLEPATGKLCFANAGHPLPFRRTASGEVEELVATGMPLGLLEGMEYEETETVLRAGESILMHSDGIAEAHNDNREMFGFPRLSELVGEGAGGQELLDEVLVQLRSFVGATAEQEDDITLVTLQRSAHTYGEEEQADAGEERLVDDFQLPSNPGNDRQAMDRVAASAAPLGLPAAQMDRLKTAVSEATMNAIEHGNGNNPDLPVSIQLLQRPGAVAVRITDCGPGPGDTGEPVEPDLEAKLEGLQTPRGWGLFLIKNMVDELHVYGDDESHTLELVLHTGNGVSDG